MPSYLDLIKESNYRKLLTSLPYSLFPRQTDNLKGQLTSQTIICHGIFHLKAPHFLLQMVKRNQLIHDKLLMKKAVCEIQRGFCLLHL